MRCFVQRAMRLSAIADSQRVSSQLLQFKFSSKVAAVKVDKKTKTHVVAANTTDKVQSQTSVPDNATITSSENQKKTKKTKETKPEFVIDRLNLTPHQFWLSQGKGMERPYTGDKWFEKDVGYYHCAVCATQLFTWDHKFQDKTGMASFWHHEKDAIKLNDKTDDVETSFNNVNVNLLESQ